MDKIIKSKERVRNHGEVYTPANIVCNMCDLIPGEIWQDINAKFLEPCCGNGNILAEIAKRKFERCKYAAKCPHKQRPMVEYLCFERKCTSTTMKKQENDKKCR